ncbi:hypothetical protein [Falsiroseomonas sp. CW058]|uniref:hypothetical protein n=1 Tax=Falsiroseomonas sp. CW058 TaxID=3388664 RepID=UPI003D3176F9
MPDDLPPLPRHGAPELRGIRIDAYSTDLPVGDGQLGDRASHRAFDAILAEWRRRLVRGGGQDPFGDAPQEEVPREALDAALAGGAPEAAGLVQGAIEDFARNLAGVIRRFLALPEWRGTQRVVVGGGFRSTRIGEIALGRAGVLLKTEGVGVTVAPIRHDPDEAGLIGGARLLPARLLAEADAVLAADLGGTSFRAGVVLPRLGVRGDMAAAGAWKPERWRHGRTRVHRDQAVARLAALLAGRAREARAAGFHLAPVAAVCAPGVIAPDGRIRRGAENLPGDWQAEDFHLPTALAAALAEEGEAGMEVLLHNDAVAQGLSEAPFQRDVARWAVLTIGTGLGNARFTNLPSRG